MKQQASTADSARTMAMLGSPAASRRKKRCLPNTVKSTILRLAIIIVTTDGAGTNFDRPDFKRMLDDIEAEKINMVIVKDLSRFGREYAADGDVHRTLL